jgi:hypothetical protein
MTHTARPVQGRFQDVLEHWKGLDPTNGIATGLDHIRVATRRNDRDATPTCGLITTAVRADLVEEG